MSGRFERRGKDSRQAVGLWGVTLTPRRELPTVQNATDTTRRRRPALRTASTMKSTILEVEVRRARQAVQYPATPHQISGTAHHLLAFATAALLLFASCSNGDDAASEDTSTSTQSASSSSDSEGDTADNQATDPLAAGNETDPWTKVYCSTLQELASAETTDQSDAQLPQMIIDSLAAADDAEGKPDGAHADAVAVLRADVSDADIDPSTLGLRPFSLCYQSVVGNAARYTLDDADAGFTVCRTLDVDLMFKFVPSGQIPPSGAGTVSLWSDGPHEDPIGGTAVQIQGPDPAFADLSGELNPSVEVTAGLHDDAWDVIATVGSTAGSTTTTLLGELPPDGGIQFAVTVLGTDRATAASIGDSLQVVDGVVRPGDETFTEIVPAFDTADLSIGAWMFEVTDDDGNVTMVTPSPVTPADMAVLMDFSEVAGGVDPSSKFEQITVGGKDALFGSDPESAGLFTDVSGATLQLLTLDSDAAYRDVLVKLAENLRTATPAEWIAELDADPTCDLPASGN